jgi:CHAT domain-containing protein
MRPGSWALILLVALFGSFAHAGPKEDLAKLQTELSQLQVKQANVAAIKVAKQVVDLNIKIYGKDATQVYYAKQNLGSLYNSVGDYVEAMRIFKELAATTEKLHGADSKEMMWALSMQTGPLWAQNRIDEAMALDKRMVEIAKKVDGENSLTYAQQLETYAMALYMRNEYTAAIEKYEQAAHIFETTKGGEGSLQGALQMTANLYWQMNQKPKAIALNDKAIELAKKSPYATPLTIGSTMYGVASQYHMSHRDDLALPIEKQILEMYDKEIARLEKDKPDDFQITSMLGLSGYLAQQMNDLPGAEDRLHRAMDIDEKNHRPPSWGMMLAEIERENGKPKEALALIEKAAAAQPKTNPMMAVMYNMSEAMALKDMGEYKRAEKLMLDYLAWAEKQYGRKHPMYGTLEVQLAYIYMAEGDLAKAEHVLAESLESSERELQNVLKTGTDNDHAVYFSKNGYLLDTTIAFNYRQAQKNAAVTRLALTTLLRRKGRILDAAAASLATIRARLSPDDKKLLDELATARAKLAKLTVAGPAATGDPDDYAKELAALEDEVQRLELQVGKKSAAYRAVSTPIELASIQKLIPADARLVEIVNFQPSDPKGVYTLNGPLPPRRYAAYVVGRTGDPVFVDLAPADDIDDAVTKFRKAVSDPDNDRASELGHALYQLTMAKIAPALGSSTNILIAPDGTLNVVPFSALVDDRGDFLVKKLTFTYLTSGRDLLRISAKTKAQGGGVIIADPSFDSTGKPAKDSDGTGSRGMRSIELSSLTWPRLPGTAKEADAVAKTWHGLKVLRGTDATESAVKAVHGPKILHLATHGFFLPDEPPPPAQDNRGGAGAAAMMPAQQQDSPIAEVRENPLLRSGLALAGANKLESGDEDGILTALEASGLDLEGTKLVVLSACETGVGKVTNGDGVYGLRRALVIAGAESLVMSLWQVDDEATKDLMVGYYARLAKGESRSSALRDVQLELQKKDKFKHPYYWASFLPAGDNSPLKE